MGDVVGVEAPRLPLAEWRRSFSHGVQVVEVGLQVREHQDRGEEEDGEGQVEVERGRRESKTTSHVRHADDVR